MGRRLIYVLVGLLCCTRVFAAQTSWNNGDSGLTVRTAIQANDTELYTFMNSTTTPAGLTTHANLGAYMPTWLALANLQAAIALLEDGDWTIGAGADWNFSAANSVTMGPLQLGNDADFGDFDVTSVDKLEGVDANTYVDIGASGIVEVGGGLQAKPRYQTDAAGGITIIVNAINYGTSTGDADIPDGACDAAGDVGNWVVLISSTADTYSLTSDDASNYFILADNTALDAGDELDVDGTLVSVMCVAPEVWKVTAYIDTAPTDGGVAD